MHENLNERKEERIISRKEFKMDEKPAYQPPSTKKWEAALEKAKEEREMKEIQQREREKQEKERLAKSNKVPLIILNKKTFYQDKR